MQDQEQQALTVVQNIDPAWLTNLHGHRVTVSLMTSGLWGDVAGNATADAHDPSAALSINDLNFDVRHCTPAVHTAPADDELVFHSGGRIIASVHVLTLSDRDDEFIYYTRQLPTAMWPPTLTGETAEVVDPLYEHDDEDWGMTDRCQALGCDLPIPDRNDAFWVLCGGRKWCTDHAIDHMDADNLDFGRGAAYGNSTTPKKKKKPAPKTPPSHGESKENSPLGARSKTLEARSETLDVENNPTEEKRSDLTDRVGTTSGGSQEKFGASDPKSGADATDPAADEPGYRERLEDLEAAGQLEAWDVRLPVGSLPRQAKSLRVLVARLEHWMGLRLDYSDFRRVPLSRTFVAELAGWTTTGGKPDRDRAREALRTFERHGVIVRAGQADGVGDREGALLFLPPEPLASDLGYELSVGAVGAPTGQDAVEREAGVVEPTVAEPDAVLADEPGVDGTQSADPTVGGAVQPRVVREDDGVVAVGLEAGQGSGVALGSHDGNGRRRVGRPGTSTDGSPFDPWD